MQEKIILESLNTNSVDVKIQNSIFHEGMEYDIYRYIDVGVLVQGEMDESGKIRRYIEEIGVFQENYEGKNQVAMVAKKGRLNRDKIPCDLKDRLEMEA